MILLLFLLVSLSEAASVLEEVKNAKVGQSISLPFAAADSPIRAVKWTRSDLESAEYVLLYRDGRPDPTYQQPSFKGRVHLSESEVKKGDLSLIRTDVRSSDSRTYDRAVFGGSGRNKRALIDSQHPIKTTEQQVSYPDTKNITVKPGEAANLTCQGPLRAAIKVLIWKRSDLKSEGYVFFFRDNRPAESFQLECYRGRVELRDPEMKNGNASVILRNVTVNDTGTYECFVPDSNRGRRRRATDIRRTINLKVTEPGATAGHAGHSRDSGDGGRGHGGLVAPIICVSGVVCLVVLFVRKSLKRSHSRLLLMELMYKSL